MVSRQLSQVLAKLLLLRSHRAVHDATSYLTMFDLKGGRLCRGLPGTTAESRGKERYEAGGRRGAIGEVFAGWDEERRG